MVIVVCLAHGNNKDFIRAHSHFVDFAAIFIDGANAMFFFVLRRSALPLELKHYDSLDASRLPMDGGAP